MCGIAGIISPEVSLRKLRKMLSRQQQRGPDATGEYLDQGTAALGHNRLAIIDLSSAAEQPFHDPGNRYHLTFNGEIYNYKELKKELHPHYPFRTSSDTEVLLAAYIHWGKTCLQKLNGMFAFAIWDAQERKLFAARDRFGVKPFYYTREGEGFYFSSEIKAIQAVLERQRPNEKVWAKYFTYGSYGLPNESFFEDIHQLQGGHYLEFTSGSLQIHEWYDFVGRVSEVETGYFFQEAQEVYLGLLKDSIQLRFRADVPVGFNLSGGVDSSLLLALVNQMQGKQNIRAFTFYTGDARYDELPWVEQMIANMENPLTKVKLSAKEVPELAARIAMAEDEPYGGLPTLAYSKIFEQAKKQGVKVLLDGQGMDEQWAGYDYYAAKVGQNIQGIGNKSPFRPKALNPEFAALAQKPEPPTPFSNSLQNLQYRDLFYTKVPRALRFNDRISMLHSTELREPFLDYRLVEFAFAQPRGFKIHEGVHKYLLRELLKPMVSEDLSYAPKRALQTPQREWLGDDLKEFVEARLASLKHSEYASWFDFEEMEREWQAYLAGDRQSSFHLWQWIGWKV